MIKSELETNIAKAETLWYKSLYSEIETLFAAGDLPSHDHTHHKRVWEFARELLVAYNISDYPFIEGLLFACFFHDSGLSKTTDEKHGMESWLLLESFLSEKNIELNELLEPVREAVIEHDNKEYTNTGQAENLIYKLLAVADDLDAMGALGVLRYIEIYDRRGIDKKDMVEKIISNLNMRYWFVESKLNFDTDLLQRHKQRYDESINILQHLDEKKLALILDSIHNLIDFDALLDKISYK
ncbi:MAG: HD domain-containing protein [Bacteroidales bacterium]|nr:HD domain-containing protein [Bacteroidales bacterium]MBN2819619.1 HD domain-containing protein [Bacteroidales bacterium]